MISKSSEKTYQYYLNCYKNWCTRQRLNESESLELYKAYLKNSKRSDAYIRNSLNVISKKKNIPLKVRFLLTKSSTKFRPDELIILRDICKNNYKSEEISLLLLILLETPLKMKDILKLTKLDIYNILSKKQTLSGKKIPQEALYVFEYLLTISLQKDALETFFTKTYHCYLHNFKSRQRDLFPNKPYRTFNAIHVK